MNPARTGTKCAARYRTAIPAGGTVELQLRWTDEPHAAPFTQAFADVFRARIAEADEFYSTVIPAGLSDDARNVMRQAFGGLLWSKQFYHYDVREWLAGDPGQPPPPDERRRGRNHDWRHLNNADVLSMPDKWEYPWYASWDLAFHCIPLSLVDATFAKEQLVLLLREWYMDPNGQLPAYEWNFSDVNPPVHAWSALRVFRIDRRLNGRGDFAFLERVFHKLLLNFTWWINRKDAEENNIFEGGFLGLDNIGVFDRDHLPPGCGELEQSDATSWMAMYTLNMLGIEMQMAAEHNNYADIAPMFFEHFLSIAHAMTDRGDQSLCLWNEEDGFFYDVLYRAGERIPLRVRSVVGLMPLFGVEILEPQILNALEGFRGRMEWFLEHRPDLTSNVASITESGEGARRLLSIVDTNRIRQMMKVMLDEEGVPRRRHPRAVARPSDIPTRFSSMAPSRWSTTRRRVHHRLFAATRTGAGPCVPGQLPADRVAAEVRLLLRRDFRWSARRDRTHDDALGGRRVVAAVVVDLPAAEQAAPGVRRHRAVPDRSHWRDLFYSRKLHGDTGQGVGASHQTGWTAVVAKLLQQSGEKRRNDA